MSLTGAICVELQQKNAEKSTVVCKNWWVVEPTHLKNMLVNLDHETPIFGVKIPKIFELPPPIENGCFGKRVFFMLLKQKMDRCLGAESPRSYGLKDVKGFDSHTVAIGHFWIIVIKLAKGKLQVKGTTTGWCSTVILLLICSSFTGKNDHPNRS